MGKVLLEHNADENIFASLKNILNENKPYNKTIISVIKNENVLNEAVNRISNILDIDNKKRCWIFICFTCITISWWI